MKIDVFYYDSVESVDQLLATADATTTGFVIDRDDHARCRGLPGFEHVEHQASYLMVQAADRELRGLRRQLLRMSIGAQLIRLRRYLISCQETERESVWVFIQAGAINVYDLGLCHDNDVHFHQLTGDGTTPFDPSTLVLFFGDDAVVTETAAPTDQSEDDTVDIPGAGSGAIVFVVHDNEYGLYTRPLWPVFEELTTRNAPFEVVACDSWAEKHLREHGVEHTTGPVLEYVPTLEDMAAISSEAPPSPGETMLDALLELGRNSALLGELARHRKWWRLILREGCTDVVLAPDGTPRACALSPADRTDVTFHAIVASGVSSEASTQPVHVADYIHVYGLQAVRALQPTFPSAAIVPVGNTSLYLYDVQKSATGPPSIVIATSSSDEAESRWISAILAEISPAEATINLKPHPIFADRYRQYVDAMHGHVLVDHTASVEHLVGRADLVITDHSQVGRDALLLGKPVISMMLQGEPVYLSGVASVIFCREIPDLVARVRDVLAAKSPPDPDPTFIADYNYGGDGKFYVRSSDLLLADDDQRPALIESWRAST